MIKLAVLDADGTLHPRTLGLQLLTALIGRGLFAEAAGREIHRIHQCYQAGALERSQMLTRIYHLYGQGIAGLATTALHAVSHEVWVQEQSHVYPFVPSLLARLREQDFVPVLLSGSPHEIIVRVAEHLGIDHISASTFETDEGRYTGRLHSSAGTSADKLRRLDEIVAREAWSVDWERSFAIGDSASDAAVLARVGLPLAFEPTHDLAPIATDAHWGVAWRSDVLAAAHALLIPAKDPRPRRGPRSGMPRPETQVFVAPASSGDLGKRDLG